MTTTQVAAHAGAPHPSPSPVSGAAAPTGDAAPVPTRADGLQLLGEMKGSGYRRPPALARRADGQTITLTPLLYLTLAAIDGQRGYADIADVLSTATGRHVVPDDVSHLVEAKLRPLGLVDGGEGPATGRANPLLALRFKVVVTDQAWTRRLTAPFAGLFRPAVAVSFLAGFVALTWWLLVDKGLGSAVHQAFYAPGMMLLLWAMIIASAGFHEFGHAAACRYGGATPGAMGAGLYLVWPAFYTDVTDSYRLGRGGRLRVDLGGLYFNAIFAVLTLAAWAVLRWDALLLVAVAQHLQMVRQLAPFIRADGYHIVADLTGVPDLFAHIRPTLQALLPRRWRGRAVPALKPWARGVVVLWVATMVPVLVGLLTLGILLLPKLAATAWDSMGVQWDAAGRYWADGDLLGVLVRALTALVVLLPVLALLYLLVRILRRCIAWAWRRSEGSVRGRVTVALAAAAVAAVLGWAWWPSGQYTPVEADDSVLEMAQLEDRRTFLPLLDGVLPMRPAAVSSDPGSAVPSTGAAGTSPTGTAGTEEIGVPGADSATVTAVSPDATALAPVLGASIPELEQVVGAELVEQVWPFPFPPPEQPGEGDNRAQAINTLDDAVVMDLAVSWALVTASQVDERNEAWALASCEDCITRAAAFQVLLLVSDSDVVVPLNAAVAANYECVRCTTEAIAVQLVVSLTGVPSAEAQQRIDEAMDKLALLEDDMAALTGGQVYYLILATQSEILRVLAEDGVLPDLGSSTTSTTTGTTTGTATGTTGTLTPAPAEPTPDATATDTATSSGTATEPTTDPGTTTDSTSTQSTAEPTAEPSPQPTTGSTTGSTTGPTDSTSPSAGETTSSEPTPSPTP